MWRSRRALSDAVAAAAATTHLQLPCLDAAGSMCRAVSATSAAQARLHRQHHRLDTFGPDGTPSRHSRRDRRGFAAAAAAADHGRPGDVSSVCWACVAPTSSGDHFFCGACGGVMQILIGVIARHVLVMGWGVAGRTLGRQDAARLATCCRSTQDTRALCLRVDDAATCIGLSFACGVLLPAAVEKDHEQIPDFFFHILDISPRFNVVPEELEAGPDTLTPWPMTLDCAYSTCGYRTPFHTRRVLFPNPHGVLTVCS